MRWRRGGLTSEIGEHRIGPGEGRLGIDEPVLPSQRRQARGEGCSVAQAIEVAEEGQPTRRVNLGEAGQEEPPEQAREDPHRQQEAGPAGYPTGSVERYPAARHDHVNVRVVGHRRAPAMEHRGGADAGAEVLGVGGDGEQRLGRGAEQQIVDHRLVLVCDRSDLGRQGEDEVEVADRQQIGFAGGEPVPRRRTLALGTKAVVPPQLSMRFLSRNRAIRASEYSAISPMLLRRQGKRRLG